ncbi:MAG TPA: hypothetical protein VL860_00725, partial [Planctomycetota bacterium]|nr:hypothetical protein [Planctomycetota bacterium]
MKKPGRHRQLLLISAPLACLLVLCSGCGALPAPTVTPAGGDLIVHHELDYYRLLSGATIMFRDEAVIRFVKQPAVEPAITGPWVLGYQNDPKTQLGSERMHPFMAAPLRPMPELAVTPETHPPEMPQAAQAYRVVVGSHWDHHLLRDIDAETEWVVGLEPAHGNVLFQLVRESRSELTETSYTWQMHSQVAPLPAAGPAETRTVGVGEFSQENAERVQLLLEAIPALGENLRNA